MKKILFSVLILTFTSVAFGQDGKIYGPIPYRTLQETIGQKYIIDKLSPRESVYFTIIKAGSSANLSASEGGGKVLTLESIGNERYRPGHFKDEAGIEYTSDIFNNHFPKMTLKSDVDEAKAMFLNKTLWLNNRGILKGNPDSIHHEGDYIDKIRFEPMTVIDVWPAGYNAGPVVFILKTADGKIGYIGATVSGTNRHIPPNDTFKDTFFTKDPKLKFSPAMWKKIKQGSVELGMSEEAVLLIKGRPNAINSGGTLAHPTQQWVYRDGSYQSYIYFTNSKVTDY